MEVNAKYICRFCLKSCHDFESIQKVHYESLHALTLTLDLAISHEPVICKICAMKLQKCLAFKRTLDIIDTIQNTGFCLFCKKQTSVCSVICLNSGRIDILLLKAMMEQYFPELHLHTNANLDTICASCYEVLQENVDFILNCLSAEQQINKYCGVDNNSKGQIELRNIGNLTTDTAMGTKDCFNSSCAIKQEDCCIGENNNDFVEYCEYKTDYNNKKIVKKVSVKEETILNAESGYRFNDRIKLENVSEHEIEESIDEIDIKTINHIEIEETWLEENISIETESTKQVETVDTIKQSIEAVVRKSARYYKHTLGMPVLNRGDIGQKNHRKDLKVGPYRKSWWATRTNDSVQNSPSFSKSELKTMITPIYVLGEQQYQCDVCLFAARARCSVYRHMMRHQKPSELKFYHCNDCKYKTNIKSSLATHVKCHKDPSRVPLHQCRYCPFRVESKHTLRSHVIEHKECPNVTVYECYTCGYKTCYKKTLVYHVRTHRKPKNQSKIYKCDDCTYWTRIEDKLEDHLTKYLHSSQVPMYKCDNCNYESNFRHGLGIHKQSHREPVKCKYCEFKSKFSAILNRHILEAHT